MSDVRVPDIRISVNVAGEEVARFSFYRTDQHPQDWEVTAALRDGDSKQAVRACLLACVSEIGLGSWEHFVIEPESGGATDDQVQLPWS